LLNQLFCLEVQLKKLKKKKVMSTLL